MDYISPTLDLTYPEDGAEYAYDYDEWVNVNAEVQDYSIARVEFYVYRGNKATPPAEGLEPFAVRTVAPFNVNWTIGEVGEHTFYVIAVDAAGNVSRSDAVTIRVVPREEE